jgi:hypothetical protein
MSKGRPKAHKRQAAIAALLSSGSIGQAAERSGVCEKTLRLWMAQTDFASEYRRARQQVVEHAVGILQTASLQAVAALVKNLQCGRPAVEVSAANSLLQHSLQGIEQCDLVGQIEALQELLAQQGIGHENRNTFPNGQAHGRPGR